MDYGYGGSYYGGRKKRSGILIFVLLLVVAVIIFSLIKGLGGRHRAIAGIREPIQKETTGHVDTKVAGYDVHIEYKVTGCRRRMSRLHGARLRNTTKK